MSHVQICHFLHCSSDIKITKLVLPAEIILQRVISTMLMVLSMTSNVPDL